MMTRRMLAVFQSILVGGVFPLMALADATANVTNLIGRLDPLTANVLSNFVMLTNIPRPTYHEKKASDALFAWAEERRFNPYQDKMNNVWFHVPATPGMETKPKVFLQGHMDMVAAGFDDPESDPVVLDCDETGKLFSKNRKTSIGADDGVGVAMALVVADGKIPHGPMCVLVTTDEEQTETGARALTHDLFERVPYLINLDSETDGELTISSAALYGISVTGAVGTVSAAKPSAYRIEIGNFRSGHSGFDIDKGRLNAIIELGRILTNAVAQGVDFELAALTGGTAYNAIAPHAQALVTVDESARAALEGLLAGAQTAFRSRGEAGATVGMVATNGLTTVLAEAARDNVLKYLTTVHDGVWSMSSEIPGLVETSMNHGLIRVTGDGVLISGAARGSVEEKLQNEEDAIRKVAEACGFGFAEERSCAPWPANPSNPLIGIFTNAWKKVCGAEMKVVAVHAGLECGWFSRLESDMNIVSVGPTIQNPHTVNETTSVDSISNNVYLLSEVLATLYHRIEVIHDECVVLAEGGTYTNPPYDGNGALAQVNLLGCLDGTDVAIVGNEATGDGGAIYNFGQVKLSGSQMVFSNNVSKSIGGAIFNYGEVNFWAADTVFHGNRASNNGGAIHNEGEIIMAGRVDLQTPSDTWVNFGTEDQFAKVCWDLWDVTAPGDSVCIRNYRHFTNATDCVLLHINVPSNLPLGDYTLATDIGDDLTGKNRFLLSYGNAERPSITTNGREVVCANRTYALSAQDEKLILTVGCQPVCVVTNAALDVAGMTWKLVDSIGKPFTEVDSEGRFVVQSNSVVNVLYTAEEGTYFADGSRTFMAGFKATGAEVFDAAERIAARKPDPSDVGEPMLQLGVVAQRYPWNGILDVQYKATHVPVGTYRLKLTVEVDGVKTEATTRDFIRSGVSTVNYDVKVKFGEVKSKNCKVTVKLDK